MIQIRKEEHQKKQKEKKLKVYKVNTHKKTVIALWVLLAVSFLFAVYKNFTAIDIHTVHETKVIEETILNAMAALEKGRDLEGKTGEERRRMKRCRQVKFLEEWCSIFWMLQKAVG